MIDGDGRWPAYGHGLGHGIGLATHELPRLGRQARKRPLPGPTVFSVEPGIYLEGETGVRIEDLVHADPRPTACWSASPTSRATSSRCRADRDGLELGGSWR